MNEQELEIKEKERANRICNKFCELLNECEKSFELKHWESGEGKDIIINMSNEDNQEETMKLKIGFFDTGYISFEYEKLEDKKQ